MKSVTVVGAEGFIGSALVGRFRQNGYQPITITRNSKITTLDTNIIFYVAGSSTPHNAEKDIAYVDNDLQNLIQFLSKLKSLKSRPLFVFASSAGTIYDPLAPQPYTESSPLSPANLHGRGKLAQETVVKQSDWVDPLILRLSNIYGPHQKPKPGFGVIAHWAQKICNHETIEMMGNSARDYLNILDLLDIAHKIMQGSQSCYAGLTVNVGSGEATPLNHLYEIFVKSAGKPIEVNKNPGRAFDSDIVSIDISLAKKLFDWKPKIPLELGVKGVLDSYCNDK